MKRVIFVFVFLSLEISAQNLVPNPSFEIYNTCPLFGDITNAVPWYSPNGSSPDYFNPCTSNNNYSVPSNLLGFQKAYSGSAYIGMIVYVTFTSNAGEYVQVKLSDTLLANEIYCVSFYVNPANLAQWGCNKIGCYFSDTAVTACGSCQIPYIPQIESLFMIDDTSSWVKVSGFFTAVGNEQYLTIGNFRSTANTDTVTINSSVNNPEAYFYIDDVSVMLCSDTSNTVKELNNYYKIELFPNLSNGEFELKYRIKQNDTGVLKIFNLAGQTVSENVLNPLESQFHLTGELSNGIYLYQFIVNDKTVKTDKLVILK